MKKKNIRRLMLTGLLIILFAALFTVSAYADSGSCGKNATYTLEDGVLTISGTGKVKDNAFDCAWGIRKLVVNEGITAIGRESFCYCYELQEIVLPQSVTTLYDDCFEGCSNLNKAVIPASVETVGEGAFSYCGYIEELRFLGDCPEIGRNCFWATTANIYVTDSWGNDEMQNYGQYHQNYIGGRFYVSDNVYMIQTELHHYRFTGTGEISGWTFPEKTGVVYLTVEEGITAIGDKTCLGCTELIRAELPSSLKTIGAEAFSGCEKLQLSELPKGLTSIGASAFLGCKSITGIKIPDTVTSVGSKAFCQSGLQKIDFPGSVKSLGSSIFYECTELTEAILRNGVPIVSNKMFDGCEKLKVVFLPGSITEIGIYAFYRCNLLSSISIPEGVKVLGDAAFLDLLGLTSIEIPGSVETIGSYCFDGCLNLSKIVFHEGLVSIKHHAFCDCPVTELNLPSTLKELGETCFASLKKVRTLVIPESVTVLASGCFQQMTSLTSLTIPEGVKTIGSRVFVGCMSLSTVTIPSTVESIGKRAFAECSSLKKMTFLGEDAPAIDERAFEDSSSFSSIVVPYYGSASYANAFSKTNCKLSCSFTDETLPEEAGVIRIQSDRDLALFLHSIAGGNNYSGKTVLLTADVDFGRILLQGVWPEADKSDAFRGHFDGGGHSISNLVICANEDRLALFRSVGDGAVVENLTIKDSKVEGKNACAALIGYASGAVSVQNVTLCSATVSGYDHVGGIAGEVRGSKNFSVANCLNEAAITAKNNDAAGILAYMNADASAKIENCRNFGEINSKSGHSGGIAGYLGNNSDDPAHTITDCQNNGSVTTGGNAGGIVGGIRSDSHNHSVSGCSNLAEVQAQGAESYAGGIIGYLEGGGSFSGNENRGDVTNAGRDAGGIVGAIEDDPCSFEESRNTGKVHAVLGAGGIVGYAGDKDNDPTYSFKNCTNEGEINSQTTHAGGIAGNISSDSTRHVFENNECFGNVTGYSNAGGIVGWMRGGGSFTGCSCSGNVTADAGSGYAGGAVGRIEDDACKFADINFSGQVSGKHSAYCCGWDGKNKGPIGEDLTATMFLGGNIFIIAGGLILIAAVMTFIIVRKKKAGKNKA